MQTFLGWYDSLSPFAYWSLVVLLAPIWLMLLGLVICLVDPGSIGNFFEEGKSRYGSWRYPLGLMVLGAFASIFLGPILGVLWYFCWYKA